MAPFAGPDWLPASLWASSAACIPYEWGRRQPHKRGPAFRDLVHEGQIQQTIAASWRHPLPSLFRHDYGVLHAIASTLPQVAAQIVTAIPGALPAA